MKEIKKGDMIIEIFGYRVGAVLKVSKSKRKCYINFRDKHRIGDKANGKEWVDINKLVKVE